MAQQFPEQQKTEAGKEEANNPHRYQGALQSPAIAKAAWCNCTAELGPGAAVEEEGASCKSACKGSY